MLRKIKNFWLFKVEPVIQDSKVLLWKVLGHDNPELRKVKGMYSGKRCFIICNGPSLTIQDLNKLKDEYTFSMNSVIKRLNETIWHPTFYGIQDLYVYEKIEDEVVNLKCEYKFITRGIEKTNLRIPNDAILFDHLSAGHYATNPNPIYKFGIDLTKGVYDGNSITYSLLQIAVFMGFVDIYIIGCDCSYSSDPSKQHFANSGHIDPLANKGAELQMKAFLKAKEVCDQLGVRIYNATRGGALEVFERVNLDDVLNIK